MLREGLCGAVAVELVADPGAPEVPAQAQVEAGVDHLAQLAPRGVLRRVAAHRGPRAARDAHLRREARLESGRKAERVAARTVCLRIEAVGYLLEGVADRGAERRTQRRHPLRVAGIGADPAAAPDVLLREELCPRLGRIVPSGQVGLFEEEPAARGDVVDAVFAPEADPERAGRDGVGVGKPHAERVRRHSCIKDFASFFQTPSKFYEREATNQPVSCISCL